MFKNCFWYNVECGKYWLIILIYIYIIRKIIFNRIVIFNELICLKVYVYVYCSLKLLK